MQHAPGASAHGCWLRSPVSTRTLRPLAVKGIINAMRIGLRAAHCQLVRGPESPGRVGCYQQPIQHSLGALAFALRAAQVRSERRGFWRSVLAQRARLAHRGRQPNLLSRPGSMRAARWRSQCVPPRACERGSFRRPEHHGARSWRAAAGSPTHQQSR